MRLSPTSCKVYILYHIREHLSPLCIHNDWSWRFMNNWTTYPSQFRHGRWQHLPPIYTFSPYNHWFPKTPGSTMCSGCCEFYCNCNFNCKPRGLLLQHYGFVAKGWYIMCVVWDGNIHEEYIANGSTKLSNSFWGCRVLFWGTTRHNSFEIQANAGNGRWAIERKCKWEEEGDISSNPTYTLTPFSLYTPRTVV